jgi:predicted nucleic acid-binding protein
VIIVDSSVWVDYFRGETTPETAWLDLASGRTPLAITDLILCEVLQGIRDDLLFARTRRELLKFDVFPAAGRDVALAAASNYRLLRRRGRTVRGTLDCVIATFCLMNGHALLHNDRDYDVFEEELRLAVVHP